MYTRLFLNFGCEKVVTISSSRVIIIPLRGLKYIYRLKDRREVLKTFDASRFLYDIVTHSNSINVRLHLIDY